MRFYGNVRQALAEHPTTWTLMEGVRDEDPVPRFPATALDVPEASAQPTSLESLRELLMEHPPADPSLLCSAVKLGILRYEEAENLLHKLWGNAFTLNELMARAQTR